MADQFYATTVIANTETESAAVNVSDYFITHIQVPASMTGTALTIKCGNTAADMAALKDSANTTITITISSAAAIYPIDAKYTAGVNYMSVVSGSAESGAKTIKLHGYKI